MNITLANKTHIDGLVDVVKSTFHLACPEYSNRELQSVYISNNLSIHNFEQFISSDNYTVFVALDGTVPVGLAVIEKVSDHLASLSKLYVLPKFHGKGMAVSLFGEALKQAKKLGYKKLNLSVYSGNLKAKSFYERQGFRLVGGCDFLMETELHKDHMYEMEVV